MTGVLDRELRSLGPFQVGVANVPAETDLPTKNGVQVALREAVNVDIPSSGAVQRREGYSLALAGTSAHSGWHDGMFPFALYVDQGTLRAMQTGGSTWPLVSGLHDAEVSYALVNERAYWSNGAQTGIVTAGGDALPWGVEHPNGQPLVSVSAAGGLAAGLYQVAVTFRDIRAALTARFGLSIVTKISEALDHYDYDQALAHLHAQTSTAPTAARDKP